LRKDKAQQVMSGCQESAYMAQTALSQLLEVIYSRNY
jgi:hypothetical protein